MKVIVSVFLVVLGGTRGPAFAQEAPAVSQSALLDVISSLHMASFVRVATATETLEGYWTGTKGDSLVLGMTGGQRVVGLDHVQALWEKSLSRTRPALFFGAVGAVGGVTLGYFVAENLPYDSPSDHEDHALGMTVGGIIGGAFGGAFGASDFLATPAWRQRYP